jgi:hypothetical protein
MTDVIVSNEGSLIGLELNTPGAIEWAAERLPDDAPRLGNIVYIEPRYVADILHGMCVDGLVVA